MSDTLTAAQILALPAKNSPRLIRSSDTQELFFIPAGVAASVSTIVVTAEMVTELLTAAAVRTDEVQALTSEQLERFYANQGIAAYDNLAAANAAIGDINIPFFDRSVPGFRLTSAYS